MTTTISRSRVVRGERNRTRVRVPDDSTTPKRRSLKRVAEKIKRVATEPVDRPRKSRVATVTKSTRRSRPRAGIGAPGAGRDGLASALANSTVGPRGRLTAPGARPASREAAKLARIRDGRYAQKRSRFIV
ncbi:MAG: hypothetical protein C0518_15605 [Opitutus sp.]|nr:hypothetical protein [Opitutus sp.]